MPALLPVHTPAGAVPRGSRAEGHRTMLIQRGGFGMRLRRGGYPLSEAAVIGRSECSNYLFKSPASWHAWITNAAHSLRDTRHSTSPKGPPVCSTASLASGRDCPVARKDGVHASSHRTSSQFRSLLPVDWTQDGTNGEHTSKSGGSTGRGICISAWCHRENTPSLGLRRALVDDPWHCASVEQTQGRHHKPVTH